MRERWAIETGDFLFEPPLTAPPAPNQRRVFIRTPAGQLFSSIVIRYHRDAPLTLHIPSALMIEQSPDPSSTSLPLTAIDQEVLRRRISQVLSTETPAPRPRPSTQPPPQPRTRRPTPRRPINHHS